MSTAISSTLDARTIRIHSVGMNTDEVNALRSLLRLLAAHIKRPWALIDSPETADVAFVNLDAGALGDYRGSGQVIGCANKPSQRPGATLHRPFRGYEVLAALSEIRASGVQAGTPRQTEAPARYRLHSWPLEFERWPREWWSVMSSITREHRSPAEIALQTGIARVTVEVCLAKLSRQGHVDLSQTQPTASEAVHADKRWHRLAARVGQILGFSR